MVPLEPALRRSYFAGLAIGIGFRWFAVAILALLKLDPVEDWMARQSWIVQAPLLIAAVSFPFAIPVFAGFGSAYFWRRVQWRIKNKDKENIHRASTLLGCLSLLILLRTPPLLAFSFLFVDSHCFRGGVRYGETFWNSRLSRQFLGDFSTRDEDDSE